MFRNIYRWHSWWYRPKRTSLWKWSGLRINRSTNPKASKLAIFVLYTSFILCCASGARNNDYRTRELRKAEQRRLEITIFSDWSGLSRERLMRWWLCGWTLATMWRGEKKSGRWLCTGLAWHTLRFVLYIVLYFTPRLTVRDGSDRAYYIVCW